MRVLAVAQVLRLRRRRAAASRGSAPRPIPAGCCEITGDHRVVARRVRKRLGREARSRRRGRAAVVRGQLREHRGDSRPDRPPRPRRCVILRGGPQHRRAADVDVLDRLGVAAVRPRDRLRERIEIHHQQIDRLDAVQRHDLIVDAAPAEQAAVDLRMQGLDAASHDLGESRVVRHLAHAEAAARSRLAVPPVERSSMSRAVSARARSTRPVLSETDSNARRTGNIFAVNGRGRAA